MECIDLIRLISDFLDEELEDIDRDEFKEHICECERCMALLHTMQHTIFFSRKLYRREQVPVRLIKKVYYEIEIRSKK